MLNSILTEGEKEQQLIEKNGDQLFKWMKR